MDDEEEQILAALACNCDVPNEKPNEKQDCSDVVNISIFFDGTGNNEKEDGDKKKWSNVARMWYAAVQRKEKCNYPIYISGVGTHFNGKAGNWLDEVKVLAPTVYGLLPGEAQIAIEDNVGGGAAGLGGDRRIEFGKQNVNDALRDALLADAKPLASTVKSYAEKGTNQSFSDLDKALGEHRRIKTINLSIFGFSRGAALARAFSNDFLQQCEKDEKGQPTYQGHPIRIHFMGLFDTVASFGLPSANIDFPWNERNLVVPESVERCVHLVAAHELRFSFPVDLIRQGGRLKSGWREEVFPGVHSDVGGGYMPVEQGLSNSYARIPMIEMMCEAVTHGVRMLRYSEIKEINAPLFDERFVIDSQTVADYERYKAAVSAAGSIEEQVTAHMKALYSSYGTMHRQGVETPYERQMHSGFKFTLLSPSMATEVARYRAAVLANQLTIEAMPLVYFVSRSYAQSVQPEPWRLQAWDKTADPAVLEFIEKYVHDSKVDFMMNAEPSSYLRPRGMWESSRNKLAGSWELFSKAMDEGDKFINKFIIKVYHAAGAEAQAIKDEAVAGAHAVKDEAVATAQAAEAVVVETWEKGERVAVRTYKVGERAVHDAAKAGEKYAVEVAQTTKDVVITAVDTGATIVVESARVVRDQAGKALDATGKAMSEAGDKMGQAADAAGDWAKGVGNDISDGAGQAWDAAKKLWSH